MVLEKELNKVVELYKNEIDHIEQFLISVEQSLARKQKRKPKVSFTKKDVNQLQKIKQNIANTLKQSKFKPLTIEASGELGKYLLHFVIPMKQKAFLAEMTLGYLVSHQEGFIKDYLFQILLHKKEMLKGNTSLSYEQILKYKSMKCK